MGVAGRVQCNSTSKRFYECPQSKEAQAAPDYKYCSCNLAISYFITGGSSGTHQIELSNTNSDQKWNKTEVTKTICGATSLGINDRCCGKSKFTCNCAENSCQMTVAISDLVAQDGYNC